MRRGDHHQREGPPAHLGFGVAVVDKPLGPTSHAVVDWVRWTTRQRAVGHCGTLDPAASGVLVLCLGAATRLAPYLTAADKGYDAEFELGRRTSTADADGETEGEAPVSAAQARAVRAELEAMGGAGPLMLPPPAFSAVKVDGRRAHALARAGERPRLDPRPMEVFDVTDVELGPARDRDRDQPDRWRLRASLRVAKGTYVRSLAEAIDRATGVPVCLAALRRTASGALGLDAAVGPLSASELPADGRDDAARRAGPRYRIRPREATARDRDGGARFVAAGLREPMGALPFACVDAGRRPTATPLIERLAQGQRLGLADPAVRAVIADALHDLSDGAWGALAAGEPLDGLAEDGVAGRFGLAAVPDPAGRRVCIVARVEHAGDRGWRVAPEVVLRDPGPPPKPPELQRGA